MLDFLFFSLVISLAYFSSLLLNINLVPEHPSEYELKRKARDGDSYAKTKAWAKKHAVEVRVTSTLLSIFVQGLFVVLLANRLGQAWAPAGLLLLSYILMRLIVVKDMLPKMFSFWERLLIKKLQAFINASQKVLRPIYGKSYSDSERSKAFYSEDEFVYRFGLDSESLTEQTRKKVDRILKTSKTKAKDIMLPVKLVPKVDFNLDLTPVIYDELHKKGYDMALVFSGTDDNFTGVLYLSGSEAVSQLNSISSIKVKDKMEQGLQYVTEDTKLDELVSVFLQAGNNSVLVTGAGGRVSGVITARKLLAWVSGS